MLLEDYDYLLPPALIAQSGAEPRDSSRLMVVHRGTGQLEHRIFRDIPEYLRPGDLLVLNQSKVIPARTFAANAHGTPIEVLLVRELEPDLWEALLKPAKRAKGLLRFAGGLTAEVVKVEEDGTRVLRFTGGLWEHLERIGQTPLPPYIHASVDPERYQTVYAKTPGSVAAPTAGLHFTPELLERIRGMGVEVRFVTLHVGPGTFKPVKEDPERHVMHLEPYEISPETAQAVNRAKAEGRRVIAVGTTVVRTLESAWEDSSAGGGVKAGVGETRLFIRPGFEFKATDALITNFHLPRSTLLMLVSAFAGHDLTMRAYRTAVEERYRFYSLGDAMLIL
ncbi:MULTISPECIES: tRNA preQ1(34) S-adenosylmethionine ribosyltransferase-isomerase QueA [unclassified Meiothermus]|uniref:tRNA preQ1(34) S-adenosylmethionine ribosyltransferase-isomerase QueA n=1 Tax=unclassified Meiothermus TaxID=370471 RepID=UPI000D7C914E|nr:MULTISPECIES: tRNA preQ1(34) S-adenosylmethionine ribosyltransferase-isomerase QueA [unclassified Meiothermus]PZA08338.1 tRNA preQ1(34) S-adenosylmethionine ribosyltransferase-isomerase QueA [Meiothermus sp. Pnk-1]RYM39007.1 tRNA preQ1(34) S-adenosylmethionine ribosyltransferase-isomerase QueA [Meiothermus sp. PNK-Is4]